MMDTTWSWANQPSLREVRDATHDASGARGPRAVSRLGSRDRRGDSQAKQVRLTGFREVPAVVTNGKGSARLRLVGSVISYELSYEQLEGAVQQAHIHVGQDHVNGGITAFLCSNLGNGPVGTPACPPSPAKLTGTIDAAKIVGPAAQGVDTGDLLGVLRAIQAGAAYVNVHSDLFPAGEVRGDIGR
jgi:CHRD domain